MIDRRLFTGLIAAAAFAPVPRALAQTPARRPIKRVRTGALEIAYEESGPATGYPILLLHGFPYDPRAFDEVTPPLAAAGYRAIVPYLRGYGETRFLSAATMRSGQQAAMGRDTLDFMDALRIPNAVLVGFDWGGRAACVAAAMWPERVGETHRARTRKPDVVPILFPHRTRTRRANRQPPRLVQTVMEAVVAELEVRRRHL
jgi:pimeloyl-ACP methyl ester carboxylesterase